MKKQLSILVILSTIISLFIPTLALANDLAITSEQAQAQLSEIQTQIDQTNTKISSLQEEINELEEESRTLAKQVDELNERIIQRSDTINNQVRSMQINGSKTSFLRLLLSSEDLADAIQRIQAATIMTIANKDLLVQQRQEREMALQKQKENAKKINKAWENQCELEMSQVSLQTKQFQLNEAQIIVEFTQAQTEWEKEKLQTRQVEAHEEVERAVREETQYVETVVKVPEKVIETMPSPIVQTVEQKSIGEQEKFISAEEHTQSKLEDKETIMTPATSTVAGNTVESTKPIVETPTTVNKSQTNWSTTAESYPMGQCTWYVKSYFGSRIGDFWGYGGQWATSARADGLVVTNTPTAYSIAVFPPGVAGASSDGHVAVVEALNADGTITISEMNWNGGFNRRDISPLGLQFILV